jgi:hypothetical protein
MRDEDDDPSALLFSFLADKKRKVCFIVRERPRDIRFLRSLLLRC